MAGSLTINKSFTLRQAYVGYTDLMERTGREKVSTNTLSAVDSRALRKSLLMLAGTDKNDNADSKDDDSVRTKFLEKVQAFRDAYNYTLESGSGSQNESISRTAGKIRNLTKSHSAELANCGISVDSKGYISLDDNAVKSMSSKTYNKYLGGDSDYNKALSKLAKKMSQHVDLTA